MAGEIPKGKITKILGEDNDGNRYVIAEDSNGNKRTMTIIGGTNGQTMVPVNQEALTRAGINGKDIPTTRRPNGDPRLRR